ncbi:unnamed protein product, partial [Staurois parvus]
AAIEKYCESCDWLQLITWYKASVTGLVPCDILFTTVHVIIDWPISDHMNQDLTQRSRTPLRTTV